MGYMGFGMQKWIYTRRARRPFTRIHEKTDVNAFGLHPDSGVSSYLVYLNQTKINKIKTATNKAYDKLDPYPTEVILYRALLPVMIMVSVITLLISIFI